MSGVVLLIVRILLVAALYSFLGWMAWMMWREIRKESLVVAKRQQPGVSLVMEAEKGTGSRQFHQKEILIGRDLICDLRLEDPTISARHARVSYRQGQWWIEDLHSKNGTQLNTTPVDTPVVITTGDRIQCGQIEFEIRIEKDLAEREGE